MTKHHRKIPWIIKYRPRTVEEVVNQEEAKRLLTTWLSAWASGKKPAKRAALLYGPPGVGKTSLVEALAREYNFELLELNASDYRSAYAIRRTVGVAAFKKALFGKGIIILLDEIDGVATREDAGGLQELLKIIPETNNPIIMTANDPWKDQLRPLRDKVLLVQFKQLSMTQVMGVLQRICEKERLDCEREALRLIAQLSQGDLRAAINDLEAIAEGYGKVTLALARAILRGREKKADIWRTLNQIFYAKAAWMAKRAVTSSEEDYETLMAWINDNIPRKYEEPGDLHRAYDALSRASLFLSRAKFKGYWSLLSYVFDLIGPGITYARKEGSILKLRYSYPERIKLMASLREVRQIRESLAQKLASRLLVSKSTVKNDILPILQTIFRYSKDLTYPARLVLGYELTKEEVKYLAGNKAEEIIELSEKIKRTRRIPREQERKEAQEAPREQKRASKKKKQERKGKTLDMFFG